MLTAVEITVHAISAVVQTVPMGTNSALVHNPVGDSRSSKGSQKCIAPARPGQIDARSWSRKLDPEHPVIAFDGRSSGPAEPVGFRGDHPKAAIRRDPDRAQASELAFRMLNRSASRFAVCHGQLI
jgi:hypothetical protein